MYLTSLSQRTSSRVALEASGRSSCQPGRHHRWHTVVSLPQRSCSGSSTWPLVSPGVCGDKIGYL